MKLGTETGSVMNHLASRATIGQPEPTVGMGATILMWTDRGAATITSVFKIGKTTYLTVQRDREVRISGSVQDGSADYEFQRNPNGSTTTYRQARDGGWQKVDINPDTGRYVATRGAGLRIGERDEYRDPSF